MSEQRQKSDSLGDSTRFVRLLWRMQSRRATVAVVLTLINGLLGGCGILLLLPLLETISASQESQRHGISRIVTSFVENVGITPNLETMIAAFLLLVGGQAWLRRRLALNSAKLRLEFGRDLQDRMFESIARVRWNFFIRQKFSELIHVLTRDLNRVSRGTVNLLTLFSSTVLVTVHLALSLIISPLLSAAVIGAVLLLAPLLMALNRRASQTGRQYTSRSRDLFHSIEQQLTGMKEIKTLGAETRQVETFQQLTQALRETELSFTRANANAAMVFTFGSAVLLSGLLLTAVNVFQVATTELLVLVVIFGRLAPQFRQVHGQYQSLLHTLSSFDAVLTMQSRLDEDTEVLAGGPGSQLDHQPEHHSIELDNVGFRYDPRSDLWALREIRMGIPVSQTTALVGPSGSGKSTLADLLLGLLLPTTGQILIDGKPLDSSNLAQWRHRIGYVPQETFLLHASVRANLLLAKPDADETELRDALAAASADVFVDQLPEGLETTIGDRGIRISGGERQRIALARALLRQPDVLILDEATSSLDTDNQNRILAAIERMHGKITIVMIAHRLSTVRHADQVVVLEQGRIVESGSYDNLATKDSGTFQSYLDADSPTHGT